MRLSKERSRSFRQKVATSTMASVATTAKGLAASRFTPVMRSPKAATSRSWMAFASMGYFVASAAMEAPTRLPRETPPFLRRTRSSMIFSWSFITP